MVIKSNIILSFFKVFAGNGLRGITIWPFIFVSSTVEPSLVLINHERIHLRQQLELLIIPFYIWYFIEMYRFGYRNISFEQEAYINEKDLHYLKKRRTFAFRKYINNQK